MDTGLNLSSASHLISQSLSYLVCKMWVTDSNDLAELFKNQTVAWDRACEGTAGSASGSAMTGRTELDNALQLRLSSPAPGTKLCGSGRGGPLCALHQSSSGWFWHLGLGGAPLGVLKCNSQAQSLTQETESLGGGVCI